MYVVLSKHTLERAYVIAGRIGSFAAPTAQTAPSCDDRPRGNTTADAPNGLSIKDQSKIEQRFLNPTVF